ncbi:GNAT family N-acetyltransferase [Pedobacter miscanthi]|uniref:GNAT family N-acetyltransferase n=1 Tax=Pedobacter miscanthi TaxID=2259170 RepID=UPI002930E6E6|nr:GNAT family N-acetyltransferase [Pedobacter miscanthi]
MFASHTLYTDRFLLRQFHPNDLASVFKGLSHPDVIRYYGVSYSSLEETHDQLTWFNDLQKNEAGIWWAICDKGNHKFYGAIGFNDLSKIDKKAEIGFWLLPEYWGTGIIKEAANPVCDYAFEKLSLRKIEAMVETENENSKKILRKLGFDYQETMKNCEIKNDRFISLAIYAKLKNDNMT